MSRRSPALLALTAVALLVAVTLPQWGDDYQLLVGYEIVQLAALAQAWNIMAGYGGLVSLAVSAFVGIGSYATTKLSLSAGLALVPSIAMGGVFAVIFAVLVAVPMFRFRGLYFTIGSLVLAQALAIFMLNYNGLGGNGGLTLTDVAPTASALYLLALACALLATAGAMLVIRGRLGLGLMAVRDDEDVAERVGVATFRVKLVSFVLSAFVMGLVGGIQAQKLGHIEPSGSFTLSWTIDSVNAAIIGGIGTVLGPIFGAAISVALSESLANQPEIHLAIIGALLIAIIRFAPAGLWGTALRLAGPKLRQVLPEWLAPRSAGAALGEPAVAMDVPEPVASESPLPAAVPPPPKRERGETVLRAAGVGKAYGGVRAVDDVALEVVSGEVLGIVGPNGAGKSTLIGLLSGAIDSEGTVELFGEDATALGAQARARRGIGRTHQVPRPFGRLSVLENLMVAQMHGAGRGRAAALEEARRILDRCGLAEFADVPAADLGLLRLKRLELARALSVKPRILFLDEIGAGLVESELRELIALIQSLRAEVESIVIVEHVLDVIRECCDRLVVLDRGRKLVEGGPDEVLGDPQVAAVYLGTSGGEDVAHARDRRGRRDETLLDVRSVAAQYGAFRALHDVSLRVGEGEVLALLGSNGAGKTTTARAISGMIALSAGEIHFAGKRVDGRPAHETVRLGVAHCMEGRRIFGELTVEENLLLGARGSDSKAERERRLGEVYELFDALREHRGNSGSALSGGQQQMLAIGRALMAAPRLVLFDEISLGLAPIMVDRLYEALAEINSRGVAMIVIEQNVERGLALADHVAVLEKGQVALTGTPAEVRSDPRLLSLYVGEAKGAAA
jgi:branched-chain amino acid transport system ATP-binding protein